MNTHPLAGKTVQLNDTAYDGARGIVVPGVPFIVEDYVDVLMATDQMTTSNWALFHYEARRPPLTSTSGLVYGKIGNLGHVVHNDELGNEV